MVARAGADGRQEVGTPATDGCCPELFPSTCALVCNFVQLLPDGPLWDRPKLEAMARYQAGDCGAPPPADLKCQSLVAYAAYLAKILHLSINTVIWPGVRESNPFTAVTSLDDWLDRMGWQDCFATLCRSTLLGQLTPYEIMGSCGPLRCDVPTSPELQCALKHAILVALQRLQVAGVKTLDVINWIIEPLDAVLAPRAPAVEGEECDDVQFLISPITKTLPACPSEAGSNRPPVPAAVPAVILPNDGQPCGTQLAGMPAEIYPGVVAAECIVRSIFKSNSPNRLFRGCGESSNGLIYALVASTELGLQAIAVDTPATFILER